MKHVKLCFLGILCMFIFHTLHAESKDDEQRETPSEYFYFEINEEGTGIVITGFSYHLPEVSEIIIPSRINNLPVVEITSLTMLPSGTKKLVFPKHLKELPEGICRRLSLKEVEEVVLSENLEMLPKNAFEYSSIKSITLPENLEYIGASAFYKCKELRYIKLPKNLVYIEYSAFDGCSTLKTVDLPEELLKIGFSAFENCEALKEITLPTTLKEISDSCFKKTGIEKLEITNGIEKIDCCAFESCKRVKTLILPKSLTKIGGSALEDCVFLNSIILANKDIDSNYSFRVTDSAFSGCLKLPETERQKLKDVGYCGKF